MLSVSCFHVTVVFAFVVSAIVRFGVGQPMQSNVVVCPLTSGEVQKAKNSVCILDLPLLVTAQDQPISILSQNVTSPVYSPNMECHLVLSARNNRKRIHITIVESLLEEPIFTDCEDYVSIKDGRMMDM